MNISAQRGTLRRPKGTGANMVRWAWVLLLLMVAGGRPARAEAPAADATKPAASSAPSAPAASSSGEEKGKIDPTVLLHKKRVDGLQETARGLRSVCGQNGDFDEAKVKAKLVQTIAGKIQETIDALVAQMTKDAAEKAKVLKEIDAAKDEQIIKALKKQRNLIAERISAGEKTLAGLKLTKVKEIAVLVTALKDDLLRSTEIKEELKTAKEEAKKALETEEGAIKKRLAETGKKLDALKLAKSGDEIQNDVQSSITDVATRDATLKKLAGEKDKEKRAALKAALAKILERLNKTAETLAGLTLPDKLAGTRVPDEAGIGRLVDAKLARFPVGDPEDPPSLCEEMCPVSSSAASASGRAPLDLCAFSDPVLSNAAVLSDWASVDAALEYVGAPRKILEDSLKDYGITVSELPGDPFPGAPPRDALHRASKRAAEVRDALALEKQRTNWGDTLRAKDPTKPLSSETLCDALAPDRNSMKAASSALDATTHVAALATGGVGGLDLSTPAAQTAEVALAALAKVIEDRAKREALVWFLEQMQNNVCGDEETCKTEEQTARAKLYDLKQAQSSLDAAEDLESAARAKLQSQCQVWHKDKTTNDALDKIAAEYKRTVVDLSAAVAKLNKANGEYANALKNPCFTADETTQDKQKLEQHRQEVVRREVRTFWLPTTCALAQKRADYVQYGGGSSLVRALQGAVASDVRAWPGIAAGLGIGAAYWLDIDRGAPTAAASLKGMFECIPGLDSAQPNPQCAPELAIRRATSRLVLSIQSGADATTALYVYAAELDDLNHHATPDGTRDVLYSEDFQVAACMMSLPRVFQAYRDQVGSTTTDKKLQTEALLLAGLTGAPACWTVVGTGWERKDCKAFSPGSGGAKVACEPVDPAKKSALSMHNAAERGPDLERLTTLLRWYKASVEPTDLVIAQWEDVQSSWEVFFSAFQALKNAGGGAPFVPPTFDPSAANNAQTFQEVMNAFASYAKDTARAAQQTQQVKLLQASAGLAKASLDFGVVLTDGLSKTATKDLYPGVPKLAKNIATTGNALAATSKKLATFSGYIATAQFALSEDWGAAVARIVATVRTEVVNKCKEDTGHPNSCSELMDKLSRYSGLFSALISEKDPEKVAEALDAAAMPIGGWRHKQIPNSFTLSLTAFAGFGAGMELRGGQYGVARERWENVYLAAPTLQMPIGLDFAWGAGTEKSPMSLGVFLSVLDPAAYLQYDPDHNNRLPGAQILTSLAPGAAFRMSLGSSPFAVLFPYVVFRPNLRTWDPSVAGPSAHAFQVGGAVSVDVSLFEILTRRH